MLALLTTFTLIIIMSRAQPSEIFVIIRDAANKYTVVSDNFYLQVSLVEDNRSVVVFNSTKNRAVFAVGPGKYEVRASLFNITTCKRLIYVGHNESRILVIPSNAARVTVIVVNDRGKVLKDAEVTVETFFGRSLSLKTNDIIYLPFGEYFIKDIRVTLMTPEGIRRVSVAPLNLGKVMVDTSPLKLKVVAKVRDEVQVELLKSDKSPLWGARVEALVYSSDGELVARHNPTEGNLLRLRNLPYGEYRLEVYYEDSKVYEGELRVSGERGRYRIVTKLIPSVVLRLRDLDGNPLCSFPVEVECPGGRRRVEVTDETGTLRLRNLVPGTYYLVTRWRNATELRNAVVVMEGVPYATVTVRVRDVRLDVEASGNAPLPPGLNISCFWGDRLLYERVLDRPALFVNVSLGKLPLGGDYRAVVRYSGNELLNLRFDASTPRVRGAIPLYHVDLKVVTMEGKPLPRAEVIARYPNGTVVRYRTDGEGVVRLRYLIKGLYDISVKWLNISVGSFTLLPEEAGRSVSYRVGVRDVRVRARGWLGPLKDVRVRLRVEFDETSSVEFAGVTDSSGRVVFRSVPVERMRRAVISYEYLGRLRGVKRVHILAPVRHEEDLFLDVVVTVGDVPLTLLQTLLLVAFLVALLVFASLALRRRTFETKVKSMFVEWMPGRVLTLEPRPLGGVPVKDWWYDFD